MVDAGIAEAQQTYTLTAKNTVTTAEQVKDKNMDYNYESSSKRSTICPDCRQPKIEWKESLTKGQVLTLAKLYRGITMKGKNDIHNTKEKGFADFTHNELCNWSKLRYHGLIFPVKDGEGEKLRARWGITTRGYQFLMGEIQIPLWVWSYNHHISDAEDARSEKLVTITDVMKEAVFYQRSDQFESRPHEITQEQLPL